VTTPVPTTANANTQALAPTAPTAPIPSGQAVLDIRDATGAIVSSVKSVTVSPVDPNVLVVAIPASQVQISLSSTSPAGNVNPVQNTTLTIVRGSEIKISAEGFLPNSEVSVYVFSTPILLGTVKTDSQGKYTSSLLSPSGLEIGSHTIQLVGFLKDSSAAKISVPIVVLQPSISKTIKVYFDMGSAKISASQLKSLKISLTKLDKKKITSITIKGYVQKTAHQKNDDKLPQLRAKSVAATLKTLGIKTKSSISEGGYAIENGERARRVEIVLKIAQ
jgi:outer membrane protein OmpA-like peptidoglycan-associated protein